MFGPTYEPGLPTLRYPCTVAYSEPCLCLTAASDGNHEQAAAPPGFASWQEVTAFAMWIVNLRRVYGNDADDVVQKVTIRLLKYHSSLTCQWQIQLPDARPLVCRIAVNCAVDFHRARKKRQALTFVDWINELQDNDDSDYVNSVPHILEEAGLSSIQQSLIYETVLANTRRSYSDLAEQWNTSIGGVRGQINRAKLKLKRYFLRSGFDMPD